MGHAHTSGRHICISELTSSKQRVKLYCDLAVQLDMSFLLVPPAATPTPINLPHIMCSLPQALSSCLLSCLCAPFPEQSQTLPGSGQPSPELWLCRTQPQPCRAPAAQLSPAGPPAASKALEMPGFADPWASRSCHRAGSALPCAGTVLGFARLGNDTEISLHTAYPLGGLCFLFGHGYFCVLGVL